MNDIKIVSELRKNGFSENNIKQLYKILSRSEGQVTLPDLLTDLKKRFYAGCLLLVVVSSIGLCKIFFNISGSPTGYLVAFLFSLYCIYQIVPMMLAWKVYRFLLKRG